MLLSTAFAYRLEMPKEAQACLSIVICRSSSAGKAHILGAGTAFHDFKDLDFTSWKVQGDWPRVMNTKRSGMILLLAGMAAWSARGATCLIAAKQVGAVRMGMTIAQARNALPGTTFQPTEDADHMAISRVFRGETRLMDLYVDIDEPRRDRAKIELIRVYDTACATAEGVHPGTLLADVEKQYGKLLRIARTEVESREYAQFEKAPSWIDIECGKGQAGVYAKGKRCASAYAPAAKVRSLWISHPRTSTRFFANDSECAVPGK